MSSLLHCNRDGIWLRGTISGSFSILLFLLLFSASSIMSFCRACDRHVYPFS
ncbi:hypothetical protein BDV29DRAFT_185403 [Aspergillus leporis]|uniref:Uncharacterized protein n=1 Tax=Aspergillus leporis TaxID=41062 RepID=A0A5N5WL40_9EURO|nr:hypothetical protein BDV29DRAFT_185403 [Aspergillus leporis]